MPDAGGHGDPLLALIGGRVRAARKACRLTQKALAARAAVSERHLAQLEGGAGNISVLLLARIAGALGQRLADLVAEPTAPPGTAGKARRIALIGLRGAGKSTLGRAAAAALALPFAELNAAIAEAAGLSPGEIFALYGEAGYRRFEALALAKIADTTDTLVLATGGGIVGNPASYELLLARFHTVWLTASPEEHMARVLAQGDRRPMAGDPHAMESLRVILASRTAQYARADARLDTAGRTIDDCVAALGVVIRSRLAA
jgi:XRE family aerobic/anaerobic benzoate catabolism transcriptional regulator